jgi:hypothetical protein
VFTVEDAKRVQRDLGLGDVHVVYIDDEWGFSLAHTDAERASGTSLWDCQYHRWLFALMDDGAWGPYVGNFPENGWYEMPTLTTSKGIAL